MRAALLLWAGCREQAEKPEVDRDGDGFIQERDCDDGDAAIFPGAPEIPYDGLDQDCLDGDLQDGDGDGHAREPEGLDCDDGDGAIYPGAPETWYDGLDSDCEQDCDFDADGDGAVFGQVSEDVVNCGQDLVDCDDHDPNVGGGTLGRFWPEEDALFDPHQPLAVWSSASALVPELELRDALGQPVPGRVTSAGHNRLLWPDLPLEQGASYVLTARHECHEVQLAVTTLPALAPTDPQALVGKTWLLDDGYSGTSQLFSSLFPLSERPLLLSVTATSDGALDLVLSPTRPSDADLWVQDLCAPTISLPSVDFSRSPALSVRDIPLSLSYDSDIGRIAVTLQSAWFGAAAVREDALDEVWLSGLVDTRPLEAATSRPEEHGYTTICELAQAEEDPCVPCPDASGPHCLLTGLQVSLDGVSTPNGLILRDQPEIDLDPSCP